MVWGRLRASERRDDWLENDSRGASCDCAGVRSAQNESGCGDGGGKARAGLPGVVFAGARGCAFVSRRGGSGRTSKDFMSGGKFTAIGIDVGGTKIAAGVVSFPSGEIIH